MSSRKYAYQFMEYQTCLQEMTNPFTGIKYYIEIQNLNTIIENKNNQIKSENKPFKYLKNANII